jgi:hypothetical protein
MSHSETFIDGVWFPSVSTIISSKPAPWLNAWREKWGERATRKMEIAAAIGTTFHDCVEAWLDNRVPDHRALKYPSCLPRIHGMVQSWISWAQSVNGIIDHTEMKVISKVHLYSGTFDAIGRLEKVPMVLDWKTGARIYPEMDLQLAAYAFAYNEMMGSKIKQGMIVHVSKDKPDYKLTTKTFKLGKRVFNKFLKLRGIFDEIERKANVQLA